MINRRAFNSLFSSAALLSGSGLARNALAAAAVHSARHPTGLSPVFDIGLMTWTFHMPVWRSQLMARDIPAKAAELGIEQLEWEAKCLRDMKGGRETLFQAPDKKFFTDLRKAADDAGVKSRVLSAGGPFYLAGAEAKTRTEAVNYYLQYVEGAQALGCDTLRAELYSDAQAGSARAAKAKDLAMTGLHELLEKTAGSGLMIGVENHHGISSQATWLADLVKSMNHPRLGLSADTNNFRTDQDMPYQRDFESLPTYIDRYEGLASLLPIANWVSAKFYAFDGTGYEQSIDYLRIIEMALKNEKKLVFSIEYEGGGDPWKGVEASVELLRRLQKVFAVGKIQRLTDASLTFP